VVEQLLLRVEFAAERQAVKLPPAARATGGQATDTAIIEVNR